MPFFSALLFNKIIVAFPDRIVGPSPVVILRIGLYGAAQYNPSTER